MKKAFAFTALVVLLALAPAARGANPASGSISPTGPTLTFVGTALGTGVVEDRYVLTVQAGDYTNKLVKVRVSWTVPSNDYDLSIYKRNPDGSDGPPVGGSGGGIPLTEEIASINPSAVGTGDFNIVIAYFANTPGVDQPQGTISIAEVGYGPTPTYVKGGITFAPNSTVKASTSGQDGEPSSRLDRVGNYYIGGIRGVPAGIDLWYFDLRPGSPTYDPYMRAPVYRGMPDSATSASPVLIGAGALGGGDIDLAVGFGNYSGPDAVLGEPQPFLAYSSLLAASVTYGRSLNRGATFQFNPVGNAGLGVPVNDRQWMEAIGPNTVYLEYRKFENSFVFIQRSTDGGLTYGPAVEVGNLQQTGSVDVDEFDGTVYVSSSDGRIAIGRPADNLPPNNTPNDEPTTYTTVQAVNEAFNHGNLFFALKVASDNRDANGNLAGPGTVYAVFSDGTDIYLVYSTNQGQTWSLPIPVNDREDPATKVNLFPWLETGPTPGSIGICWYGTENADNDDNARWRVFYAQSFNATSNPATFRIVQASDHAIHASNISLGGFGGEANRNLIDYFQMAFDPTGAAVIGYTDDHNDFAGHCFVARQISGPSINGGNVPAPVEGTSLPAQPFATPGATPIPTPTPGASPTPRPALIPQPMQPGPAGEQVTDFAQDQDAGLVGVAPANSPFDIISIKYQWQDSNQGPVLTATMKVSDLSVVPAGAWRMYFTANAPETGIIGTAGNYYSRGLSDDGDQFYVQLATDETGTRTATWGTVVRNADGSLTRTSRGAADRVFVNQTGKTISIRLSLSKPNTLLPAGRKIGYGSVLCGLRGDAVENTVGAATTDQTRGGTELTIANPF